MRVKLKNEFRNNWLLDQYDIPHEVEFDVDNQDDGFYTNHAFYQGWVKDRDGHKMYMSFEQDDCEVIEW